MQILGIWSSDHYATQVDSLNRPSVEIARLALPFWRCHNLRSPRSERHHHQGAFTVGKTPSESHGQ